MSDSTTIDLVTSAFLTAEQGVVCYALASTQARCYGILKIDNVLSKKQTADTYTEGLLISTGPIELKVTKLGSDTAVACYVEATKTSCKSMQTGLIAPPNKEGVTVSTALAGVLYGTGQAHSLALTSFSETNAIACYAGFNSDTASGSVMNAVCKTIDYTSLYGPVNIPQGTGAGVSVFSTPPSVGGIAVSAFGTTRAIVCVSSNIKNMCRSVTLIPMYPFLSVGSEVTVSLSPLGLTSLSLATFNPFKAILCYTATLPESTRCNVLTATDNNPDDTRDTVLLNVGSPAIIASSTSSTVGVAGKYIGVSDGDSTAATVCYQEPSEKLVCSDLSLVGSMIAIAPAISLSSTGMAGVTYLTVMADRCSSIVCMKACSHNPQPTLSYLANPT